MYQVKKPKTKSTARKFAAPSDPVCPSLPGTGPADDREQFLGAEFRVLDRYALQDDLVDTLKQTKKHKHLVKRVAECHRSFRHKVCGNNHQWAQPAKSCNCRLCPHDQRKRSLRLSHRWSEFLMKRHDLRYVVFSERNSADLHEGITSLYSAWKRLRASGLWKQAAEGSIAVLEVTYNREEKTWHPHLNVLFEGDYIPFEALRQEWSEATRHRGQTSFIKKADTGTVRELLKYVTKLSDFVEHPVAVDDFLGAVARRRFIRTYGTFYSIPVDETEGTEHCPDCDSDCVADVGVAHASQVVIDFKGVLRIDLNRLRPSQLPVSEDVTVAWPKRRGPVPWITNKQTACESAFSDEPLLTKFGTSSDWEWMRERMAAQNAEAQRQHG